MLNFCSADTKSISYVVMYVNMYFYCTAVLGFNIKVINLCKNVAFCIGVTTINIIYQIKQ